MKNIILSGENLKENIEYKKNKIYWGGLRKNERASLKFENDTEFFTKIELFLAKNITGFQFWYFNSKHGFIRFSLVHFNFFSMGGDFDLFLSDKEGFSVINKCEQSQFPIFYFKFSNSGKEILETNIIEVDQAVKVLKRHIEENTDFKIELIEVL